MIHFLAVMFSSISHPPQSSRGSLDEDDDVVESPDGGRSDRFGRVLGVVAGGGKNYDQALLLSCFKSEHS